MDISPWQSDHIHYTNFIVRAPLSSRSSFFPPPPPFLPPLWRRLCPSFCARTNFYFSIKLKLFPLQKRTHRVLILTKKTNKILEKKSCRKMAIVYTRTFLNVISLAVASKHLCPDLWRRLTRLNIAQFESTCRGC